MASVNVKLDAGQININNVPITVGGGTSLTFDLLYDKFTSTFNLTSGHRLLVGIGNNQELQNALNCGDSIKDGTNQAILQNLQLFNTTTGVRFTLQQLKDFVHHVEERGLENGVTSLKKFIRNKASVTSKITKEHIITLYEVAFDAATGLEQFFVNPQINLKKFESIGKYLDPSTTRDSDFIFPSKGQSIVLNPGIFVNLGYTGDCILSASANSKDNYKYDMTIYGEKFVKADIEAKNADTIRNEICGGNNVKKGILSSGAGTQRKRTIVVAKGWGDKLQVFIAFIYKLAKQQQISVVGSAVGATIAVATCDEIVYNLCCYFGVNCLLTSTGEGTLDGETKVQKINKILHYDPEGSNPADAVANLQSRFDKEKVSILQGYEDFMGIINRLSLAPPQLFVNGTEKKYTFTPEYYTLILADLQSIVLEIQGLLFDAASQQAANNSIEDLKKYTVNSFIKEFQRGQYRLAASATSYNIHSSGKLKRSFAALAGLPLTNKSFMTIGTSMFWQQGGGSIYSGNKQIGGAIGMNDYLYFMNDYYADQSPKGFQVILDKRNVLEYSEKTPDAELINEGDLIIDPADPVSPAVAAPMPDLETSPPGIAGTATADGPSYDPTPDTIQFDAIENLLGEIVYIFNKNGELQKYDFYSFWSEMMVRLEANPDYSTENLNLYANEIAADYLLIKEVPVAQQAQLGFPMEMPPLPPVQGQASHRSEKRIHVDELPNGPLANIASFLSQIDRATLALANKGLNKGLNSGGQTVMRVGGSKKQTLKYVEKKNKKTKRRKQKKQTKKSKSNKSKTRKYYKKRLS